MEQEIWKDVKGYEGIYQVSDLGAIKSLERKWVGGKGAVIHQTEMVLKTSLNSSGYKSISMNNKKMRTRPVHRIVAETFILNPERKPQVNHKNGIKTDNRVENLEWCTHLENMQHRNNVLGYKHSARTCENIRLSKLGNKNRLGIKNLPHVNTAISEAQKKTVLCLQTGVFYDCISDYCFAMNTNRNTLRYRVKIMGLALIQLV